MSLKPTKAKTMKSVIVPELDFLLFSLRQRGEIRQGRRVPNGRSGKMRVHFDKGNAFPYGFYAAEITGPNPQQSQAIPSTTEIIIPASATLQDITIPYNIPPQTDFRFLGASAKCLVGAWTGRVIRDMDGGLVQEKATGTIYTHTFLAQTYNLNRIPTPYPTGPQTVEEIINATEQHWKSQTALEKASRIMEEEDFYEWIAALRAQTPAPSCSLLSVLSSLSWEVTVPDPDSPDDLIRPRKIKMEKS